MLLLALLLIAAGVLAASPVIIKQQPNAKEMIDKLVPFQGIIGIVLLIYGLWWLLVSVLVSLSDWMYVSPIYGLGALLGSLVAIGLGFLLGYGLIDKYVLSQNADAARSGEAMRQKLVGIQVPMGIAGIVLGLWVLLAYLTWRF
jgi:hypothetical protein